MKSENLTLILQHQYEIPELILIVKSQNLLSAEKRTPQMNTKRNRMIALYAAGGACLLGLAYSVYSYLLEQNKALNETNSSVSGMNRYTTKSISIVITDSIISSNLPIIEILNQTENITFILPENLDIDDLSIGEEKQEDLQRLNYKIIKCDKNENIPPLLNHLNNSLVLYTKDDIDLNLDFVRSEIVELDQNFTNINETVLSYILH